MVLVDKSWFAEAPYKFLSTTGYGRPRIGGLVGFSPEVSRMFSHKMLNFRSKPEETGRNRPKLGFSESNHRIAAKLLFG